MQGGPCPENNFGRFFSSLLMTVEGTGPIPAVTQHPAVNPTLHPRKPQTSLCTIVEPSTASTHSRFASTLRKVLGISGYASE